MESALSPVGFAITWTTAEMDQMRDPAYLLVQLLVLQESFVVEEWEESAFPQIGFVTDLKTVQEERTKKGAKTTLSPEIILGILLDTLSLQENIDGGDRGILIE